MLDVSQVRLQTQLISGAKFKTAKEVVSHFGAMQSQDYAMAKYALGLRMENATDTLIEKALDDGEIIRTHLLRPTWHFVTPEDLHWMLELTAPNITRQMGSSNRLLGLDEKMLRKSNDIISKAIDGGEHVTRDELIEKLKAADLDTRDFRSSHFLMHAEMSGIICNGKRKNKQHTYKALPDRAKETVHYSREDALARLAKRYFSSHGPATLKDFVWWSGLSVSDAKSAIALNDSSLTALTINSVQYFATGSVNDNVNNVAHVDLLPAFDEFLIAYKDRTASISSEFNKHAFTTNGIFKPIIVVNGQVIGIWKRTIKKDHLSVEATLLRKTSKIIQKDIAKAARHFSDFMEMKLKFEFT